jgi:hypothetical protein
MSASAVGVRGLMIHLKGTGCLLVRQNDFSVVCTCIHVISLQYYAVSELWFKFNNIPLFVDWWFDVIDCKKTRCN